jgi:hypothetical protein
MIEVPFKGYGGRRARRFFIFFNPVHICLSLKEGRDQWDGACGSQFAEERTALVRHLHVVSVMVLLNRWLKLEKQLIL